MFKHSAFYEFDEFIDNNFGLFGCGQMITGVDFDNQSLICKLWLNWKWTAKNQRNKFNFKIQLNN